MVAVWRRKSEREARAFAEYWNAIAVGDEPDASKRRAMAIVPDVVATLAQIRALHVPHVPDRSFVDRLERDLRNEIRQMTNDWARSDAKARTRSRRRWLPWLALIVSVTVALLGVRAIDSGGGASVRPTPGVGLSGSGGTDPVIGSPPLPQAAITFDEATAVASPAVLFGGDPIGAVRWTASGEPDRIAAPASIDVDPTGQVYVCDGARDRFRIFSPEGVFQRDWGVPGTSAGQFDFGGQDDIHCDVAFDGNFHIFVADYGNDRVQEFNSDGSFVRSFTAVVPGQSIRPAAVAVIGDELYVYDQAQTRPRIVVFDLGPPSNGGEVSVSTWGALGGIERHRSVSTVVMALGLDALYVADAGDDRVVRLSPAGQFLAEWHMPAAGDGAAAFPIGIAFTVDNTLLAADGNRLIEFANSADVTAIYPLATRALTGLRDGDALIYRDRLQRVTFEVKRVE